LGALDGCCYKVLIYLKCLFSTLRRIAHHSVSVIIHLFRRCWIIVEYISYKLHLKEFVLIIELPPTPILVLAVNSAKYLDLDYSSYICILVIHDNLCPYICCSLLYGAEDPSIAGMVLDSAFANLYDLMMELVEVYKIRVPKFAV